MFLGNLILFFSIVCAITALRINLYQNWYQEGKKFSADLPENGCVDMPEYFRDEVSSIKFDGPGCVTAFLSTGCHYTDSCRSFNESHKNLNDLSKTEMNDKIASIALCGGTTDNEKCPELRNCLARYARCDGTDVPCCEGGTCFSRDNPMDQSEMLCY